MNTLLIDIDSLRPDHIQSYGYDRQTTPRIDELIADSVRFTAAYTANSPCLPARAGTLSGRYGINTGIETHGPRSQTLEFPGVWETNQWAGSWRDSVATAEDWLTLPETVYDHRVRTGAVSSFPRHPAPWFHRQWHEFSCPQEPSGPDESFQTVRGERVTDRAREFVGRNQDSEFFLYVQYWDPHGPYNRTDAERARFDDTVPHPVPSRERLSTHTTWDQWRSAARMGIDDEAALADLVAGYDAEIAYVDHHVGRLLDALRAAGIYDETLIILTADHGEEFGEHGLYREHWSTYDGTQRVPLVIKPPAREPISPGARDQLVTNVDIAPTIADYLGVDRPSAWDGTSLRRVVESAETGGRDWIVLDHGLYTAQRAVRTPDWKLIRTYHPGMWDETLPERQLFDMDDDPWEQTDVIEQYPGVADRLASYREQWVEEHVEGGTDPLQQVATEGPAGYRWARDELSMTG